MSDMTPPKRSDRQRDDVRKGILKNLAKGGIRQSELERMFSTASMEVVHAVIEKMLETGQVEISEVNGWNVVSLPKPSEKKPKKDLQIEPLLPKVEPILPKIEPLDREPGVFVPESPERLILSTLAEGARMRDSLVRLVAGQMSREDANKLLNKMVRSGIVSETISGRMSLVDKHGHA